MGLKKLNEMRDYQKVMDQETQFLLFKHSLTCPISQGAFEQYNQYLQEHPEMNGYYLTVQESRPLSNFIAEHFSIKHESPQIFYIANSDIKWHASHQKITKEAIAEVVTSK